MTTGSTAPAAQDEDDLMDVGTVVLDRVVREAAAELASAGIESADGDAELLAAHVVGVDRAEVARQRALGRLLTVGQVVLLRDLVDERIKRVPLQHLTGKAHLRSVTVDVGPGVFVPRPETEITIQHALEAVLAAGRTPGRPAAAPVRVVDLCTGCAVIPVAVLAEARAAGIPVRAVGVEISHQAAAWARRNAERYGAGGVEIREGPVAGCWQELCDDLVGRAHVVVANPPYVPVGQEPRDPEARDHDPAIALYAGRDGLDVMRQVATAAGRLLRPGGTVVLEHGESQGEAVRALLVESGLAGPATHPDLTGRPRVTVARRPE
jgi:release factor glutamine methyltransferase